MMLSLISLVLAVTTMSNAVANSLYSSGYDSNNDLSSLYNPTVPLYNPNTYGSGALYNSGLNKPLYSSSYTGLNRPYSGVIPYGSTASYGLDPSVANLDKIGPYSNNNNYGSNYANSNGYGNNYGVQAQLCCGLSYTSNAQPQYNVAPYSTYDSNNNYATYLNGGQYGSISPYIGSGAYYGNQIAPYPQYSTSNYGNYGNTPQAHFCIPVCSGNYNGYSPATPYSGNSNGNGYQPFYSSDYPYPYNGGLGLPRRSSLSASPKNGKFSTPSQASANNNVVSIPKLRNRLLEKKALKA